MRYDRARCVLRSSSPQLLLSQFAMMFALHGHNKEMSTAESDQAQQVCSDAVRWRLCERFVELVPELSIPQVRGQRLLVGSRTVANLFKDLRYFPLALRQRARCKELLNFIGCSICAIPTCAVFDDSVHDAWACGLHHPPDGIELCLQELPRQVQTFLGGLRHTVKHIEKVLNLDLAADRPTQGVRFQRRMRGEPNRQEDMFLVDVRSEFLESVPELCALALTTMLENGLEDRHAILVGKVIGIPLGILDVFRESMRRLGQEAGSRSKS